MAPRTTRPKATAPTISASEFKATCLELMDDVARTGTDVIVTKRGRPVVRVSAVHEERASPWGFLSGSVVGHGDIVSPDDALWHASSTDPLTTRRSR
ncbi:MAG: type II toxin-antitoxin system Phd/YefM family antitoxin [Gemmatimonadaceae bacterium]|nr:type II toxin-antitoxin system Phd/YefM family antitoxin [Gemmatimonadaceae bacterium]